MVEYKTFATEDVLSCSTGRLLGDIGGVYKVAQFFTGGPVWTHQLARLGPLMEAEIKRQHPDLPGHEDAGHVDGLNWKAALDGWIERHGATIALAKPEGDVFAPRDPVGEAEQILADRDKEQADD